MLSLMSSGSKTMIIHLLDFDRKLTSSFVVTLSHFDTHETIKPRFPPQTETDLSLERKPRNRLKINHAYRRDQETDSLGSLNGGTQHMNFARASEQMGIRPNVRFDCLQSP